jgi:hypothetical protein
MNGTGHAVAQDIPERWPRRAAPPPEARVDPTVAQLVEPANHFKSARRGRITRGITLFIGSQEKPAMVTLDPAC